jgi:hypothetical protein
VFVPLPADVPPEELHWLAGLLEGEGSFLTGPPSRPNMPVIAIQMTDQDVIERVAALFGRKAHAATRREEHWRQSWMLRLSGHRAVEWMLVLRPLMGSRRKAQIDRALSCYSPKDAARLSDETASEALALLAAGAAVKDVAARFDVSIWCIYDLRLGRTHKHLARA